MLCSIVKKNTLLVALGEKTEDFVLGMIIKFCS